MEKKQGLPIQRLLAFGSLAFLLVACGKRGLSFDDYNSPEEWRAALLQQVPVGSSVQDVLDFLDKNEVPKRSGESFCGYFHANQYSLVAGICKEGLLSYAVWQIEFRFDKNAKLTDISVSGYP